MLKKELAAYLTHNFPNNYDTLIFLTRFDHFNHQVSILSQYLSTQEKVAAKQYASTALANRHIVSRGLLKYILSVYMEGLPKQIKICYGEYGKPYLKAGGI